MCPVVKIRHKCSAPVIYSIHNKISNEKEKNPKQFWKIWIFYYNEHTPNRRITFPMTPVWVIFQLYFQWLLCEYYFSYISNDFCVSIISAIYHNNNNVTGNESCKLRLSTHNNNKLCSSEAGVIVYSISQRSVVFSNQYGRVCTQHGLFLMPKFSSWDGPLMFDRWLFLLFKCKAALELTLWFLLF